MANRYDKLKVYLWSVEWGCDCCEIIVPEHWPHELLKSGKAEDDDSFCTWVADNTDLQCTVERVRSISCG